MVTGVDMFHHLERKEIIAQKTFLSNFLPPTLTPPSLITLLPCSTFPPLSGTVQQEKNLPLGSRDRSRVSPAGMASTNTGQDSVYTLNHDVDMKL